MTTITFPCEKCGTALSIGCELLGGDVECPICKTVFQAPCEEATERPTDQNVSAMYHHARLDYEAGGSAFGILLIEILVAASGLGLCLGSAWAFGLSLVVMLVALIRCPQFGLFLGVGLGLMGGALLAVPIFYLWDESLSAAIVGGILVAGLLVGMNVMAIRWART